MFEFLRKIYRKKGGIWKYADFYAEKIEEKNRLMLGDGGTRLLESGEINKIFNNRYNTPRTQKADAVSRYPSQEGNHTDTPPHPTLSPEERGNADIGVETQDFASLRGGVEHLYFKREDQNETGSLKGRSLAYQVSLNKQRGARALVISTSGNAGIAAAAYAKKAGIKIFVFISPDTESGKVADIQKYDPIVIKSKRAIRFANYVSAKYKIPNLRPSVDDDSIEGFKSIAFEIADEAGDVDAVFTFVTSGSSFVGMYRGFEAYKQLGKINKLPRMYAVQSGEIFGVVEEFEDNGCEIAKHEAQGSDVFPPHPDPLLEGEGTRKAGQFGIKDTRRKKEILNIINKTGGRGIYVSEIEVEKAKRLLFENKIETSLEGCASFAGFMKMQNREKYNTPLHPSQEGNNADAIQTSNTIRFNKTVCILSGKLRSGESEVDESKIFNADNFEEVDKIVKKLI
jgi:threonine synthase